MLYLSKMPILKFRQKGAALIFMAFILGLGAAVYVLKTYNSDIAKAKREEKSAITLAMAKEALLAYSISRTGTGERPGNMPRPDYFASSESPANYDGDADGGCLDYSKVPNGLPLISSGANMRCVGRLPWHTLGISVSNPTQNDGVGNMPWYAVSANLANPTCITALNASILDTPYTGYVCGSKTNLPYRWLTVKDRFGNIISNRVAAVLLMPNAVLSGQVRPDAPLAGITNYLEAGNSDFDDEFTVATDLNVNDKLVYITIDELMAAVEKRVGEQVRSSLKTYQDTNGYYPYAAHLGTSLNFVGESNLKSGFLPIFQTCSYSAIDATHSKLNCTQAIFDAALSGITAVEFYLPSGTFTSRSSSCMLQSGSTSCTCTGAGSCWNGAFTFSCNATECSATGAGATGDIRVRGGNLTFSSGGCSITSPLTQDATTGCPISADTRITCNSSNGSATAGVDSDVALDNYLPAWLKTNEWQNYVYYHMTRPASSTLAVGAKSAEALIVTTGGALPITASNGSGQVRPSCNAANNYLDSVENADGDISDTAAYDATSTLRSNSYNDQNFIVTP